MARGGGSSGSGPMIFLFLICLCLSLSTGAGAYFYTKEDEDAEKDLTVTDDEFKAKYQEAMAALEVEKATKQNVEVAKTAVQLAQENLEIARLAFESGEFANDGEKEAARTRVFSAESDAEAALSNLAAAETDSERASVNRQKAEDNAESALDVAITEGETLLTKARDTAAAKLVTAEGNLAVARTNALKAIETAQGEADAAQITAAQAQKKIRDDAQALLDKATTEAETAKIKRDEAAAERAAQKKLEAELAAIEARKVIAQAALEKAEADVALAEGAAAATLAASNAASQAEEARLLGLATADALGRTPIFTTGTGGPHNGGIVWQSHDIGGRFHSPDGLVWLGGDGRDRTGGQGAWNQKYKFRCMTNNLPSSFSADYGPVNFRTYHNPKIQISNINQVPCKDGKIQVWDANTNTDITGQMKDFTGGSAYNGTDHRFYDPRNGIAPKGCQGAWDRSACGTRRQGRRNVATGNQIFRVSEAATAGGACPTADGTSKGC